MSEKLVKVKMKTTLASPEYNIHAGNFGMVRESMARELVKSGQAEYLEAPKQQQKKAATKKETAAKAGAPETAEGKGA